LPDGTLPNSGFCDGIEAGGKLDGMLVVALLEEEGVLAGVVLGRPCAIAAAPHGTQAAISATLTRLFNPLGR
jgi:hypothetical protein